MKSQANIGKPKLESITLTMTPREAYMLACYLGSTSFSHRDKHFQNNPWITKTPPFPIPDYVSGVPTSTDIDSLGMVYDVIKNAFIQAEKNDQT